MSSNRSQYLCFWGQQPDKQFGRYHMTKILQVYKNQNLVGTARILLQCPRGT